jgi:dipeptidyl aminopeptidase/acylaminoacyl peptidase
MLRGLTAAVAIALAGRVTVAGAQADTAALPVTPLLRAATLAAYSPPSFSPDRELLAYVVTNTERKLTATRDDYFPNTGVPWWGFAGDIWVTELATNTQRNISRGEGSSWWPVWSPDGRRLAFLSDRAGGQVQLWIWERSSGTLRRVGKSPLRESYNGIHWVNGGRAILAATYPKGMSPKAYAASMNGERPRSDSSGAATGATARVFVFDPTSADSVPKTDQINLDSWRMDLVVIDVESGSDEPLVTGTRVGHYAVAPNGRSIVYSSLVGAQAPGSGQYLYDLVVRDIRGPESRVIAPKAPLGFLGTPLSWSPDGTEVSYRTGGPLAKDEIHILTLTGGKDLVVATVGAGELTDVDPIAWGASGRDVFYAHDGALWRAASDGSGARELAKSPGRQLALIDHRRPQLWSPDGGRSAVVMTSSPGTKRVGLARVDLASGAVTQLFEEDKKYGGYGTDPVVSPDGSTLVYVAEDATHPADLWIADGNLTHPRQLSRVAPALSDFITTHTLGRAEVIEWRSLDGDTLRGALVYPAGYERGKRYPLLVKVYGGSAISDDLNRFGFASAAVENLQIFATRGYALLLADSRLTVGTPMLGLLKTVMPGIDRAVDMGLADPARIGVMGHSYGGYSTLSLLVQSNRFKAAVMRAGMGDMVGGYGGLSPDGTNYGLSWAETGQGRMGGSPWEFRERYLENSPVYYLDRVQTPLLIIHGEKDEAVPSFLADQVFVGLRRLGKTVTYANYAGADHWEGGWSFPNQVDFLTRVLAWFDRYLKTERRGAADSR